MHRPTRRRILRTGAGVTTAGLAGCLSVPDAPGSGTPTGTGDGPSGTSDGTTAGPLTDWERSTDCDGEYDGMHDSVIPVEAVAEDLGSEYEPIHYSELTAEERDVLGVVTEEGGYGTCDASGAFSRFLDRVSDRRGRQDADGVYLERDGTYYRLYVERADEVYAY